MIFMIVQNGRIVLVSCYFREYGGRVFNKMNEKFLVQWLKGRGIDLVVNGEFGESIFNKGWQKRMIRCVFELSIQ